MANKKSREAAIKAFSHADDIGKTNGADLAKEIGVSRSLITQSRIINEYGTEEEKLQALSGEIGLRTLGDQIKKRMTPEDREKLKKRSGTITSKFREVIITDVDLWAKFNPVLHNLTSMPRVEDMIAVITRNNQRVKAVEPLIDSAANWMEEFYHAWTTRRRKPGGSATDSGGSDADVGVQHPEPPSQ